MPTNNELKDELESMGVNPSFFRNMNNRQLLALLKEKKSKHREFRKPKAAFDILFDEYVARTFRLAVGLTNAELITKTDTIAVPQLAMKIKKAIKSVELCDYLQEYAEEAVETSMMSSYDDDYADPDSDIKMDYAYIVDTKSKKVCAILVAHRGECTTALWNTWTVRIICNRAIPECKGGAHKLLGLYCYALKTKQVQKYGLLEVADSYNNIAAYCSYSKYGFVESDYTCEAFEHLQMATDLRKITIKQIIDTVITGKAQIEDNKTLRYCEELKRVSNFNKQLAVGQDPIEVVNFKDFEPESSCSIM
jgi:hypothetical protein